MANVPYRIEKFTLTHIGIPEVFLCFFVIFSLKAVLFTLFPNTEKASEMGSASFVPALCGHHILMTIISLLLKIFRMNKEDKGTGEKMRRPRSTFREAE